MATSADRRGRANTAWQHVNDIRCGSKDVLFVLCFFSLWYYRVLLYPYRSPLAWADGTYVRILTTVPLVTTSGSSPLCFFCLNRYLRGAGRQD